MPIMRNKKNAGFTLAEMLVTFVIMLILASISVAGILAYQDYADFKRQNSYAQTLFVAAQSRLTDYSVRGQMDRLSGAAENVLDLNQLITPEGIAAKQSKGGASAKKSGLYYLTGTKETYVKYLEGEYKGKNDAVSRGYQALYDIFDEYLFDKTVLKASICLEFNPKEGQVYSVLYSDKKTAFTYEGESKEGVANICNRQEDYRSEYMIGYYGLD